MRQARPAIFPNSTGPTQASGRGHTYRYFVTLLLLPVPGLGLRERKSNAINESRGRGHAFPVVRGGPYDVLYLFARWCSLKRGVLDVIFRCDPVVRPPSELLM